MVDITKYYGLVYSIAKLHYREGIDFDDLCQAGFEGLLKAVRSYNSERGSFYVYASKYIEGHIRAFLKWELKHKLESLNQPIDDEGTELGEIIASDRVEPFDDYRIRDLVEGLHGNDFWVIAFRYGFEILKESPTYENVGRRLGLSSWQVQQIEKRVLWYLRKQLRG